MTVAVVVLIPEGVVLAADSRRISRSPSGQMRVDSDNTQKIFQLGSRLSVCVHGQGTFYTNGTESPQSIGNILSSIAGKLSNGCTYKTALVLHQKMTDVLSRDHQVRGVQGTGVGLYVAGYDRANDVGELYCCDVPGKVALLRRTSDAGMVWSGYRTIIDRLVMGYDARLFGPELLLSGDRAEMRGSLEQQCRRLQLHISFQTMSLQDAIDLAVLLVRATTELQRLSDGIVGSPGQFPTCGGRIDVAVITPSEGFRWLQQRDLEASHC